MKKAIVFYPILLALLLSSCTNGVTTTSETTETLESSSAQTSQTTQQSQSTQTTKSSFTQNSTTNSQSQDIEELELQVREKIEAAYPEVYQLQRASGETTDTAYLVTKIDIYRYGHPDEKVTITDIGILKHFFPIRIQNVITTEPGSHSTNHFIYDVYMGEKVLSFELRNDHAIVFNDYEDKVFVTQDRIDTLAIVFLKPMISYPNDTTILRMGLSPILKRGDTIYPNEDLSLALAKAFEDIQKTIITEMPANPGDSLENITFFFGGSMINMKLFEEYIEIIDKKTTWYKSNDVRTISNCFYIVP